MNTAAPALLWARDGRDWPLRQHSQFVQTPTLRWHVQVLGQGPRVLLLHGTGASTHSWRGLAPLLAQHAQVLSLDLPGHAFTQPLPKAQCTLAGMAQACSGLLAQLDFSPQLVLGHSAGAALMLHMALNNAWHTPQLVGLNAALLPFDGLAGLVYAPMARLLANTPLLPQMAAWRGQSPGAVRRLMEGTGSHLDAQGLALYARLLGNPTHVANVLNMMAQWDLQGLQQQLPQLRCPLLLLGASGDRAVPAAQAAQVAQRLASRSGPGSGPGSGAQRSADFGAVRSQVLTGLGHLAHEEAPERLLATLLALPPFSVGPGAPVKN